MERRGRSRQVSQAALARQAQYYHRISSPPLVEVASRVEAALHRATTYTMPMCIPSTSTAFITSAPPTPALSMSPPSPEYPASPVSHSHSREPTPPPSLADQVHVAYALDDIHLAKILLLRLKGIEVTGDEDPRIAAVTDEDFDFCFRPYGELDLGGYGGDVKGKGKERETQEERDREERLIKCQRIWEEEGRRMRDERERARFERLRTQREREFEMEMERERQRRQVEEFETKRRAARIRAPPSISHLHLLSPLTPNVPKQNKKLVYDFPYTPRSAVAALSSRKKNYFPSSPSPSQPLLRPLPVCRNISELVPFKDVLSAIRGELFPILPEERVPPPMHASPASPHLSRSHPNSHNPHPGERPTHHRTASLADLESASSNESSRRRKERELLRVLLESAAGLADNGKADKKGKARVAIAHPCVACRSPSAAGGEKVEDTPIEAQTRLRGGRRRPSVLDRAGSWLSFTASSSSSPSSSSPSSSRSSTFSAFSAASTALTSPSTSPPSSGSKFGGWFGSPSPSLSSVFSPTSPTSASPIGVSAPSVSPSRLSLPTPWLGKGLSTSPLASPTEEISVTIVEASIARKGRCTCPHLHLQSTSARQVVALSETPLSFGSSSRSYASSSSSQQRTSRSRTDLKREAVEQTGGASSGGMLSVLMRQARQWQAAYLRAVVGGYDVDVSEWEVEDKEVDLQPRNNEWRQSSKVKLELPMRCTKAEGCRARLEDVKRVFFSPVIVGARQHAEEEDVVRDQGDHEHDAEADQDPVYIVDIPLTSLGQTHSHAQSASDAELKTKVREAPKTPLPSPLPYRTFFKPHAPLTRSPFRVRALEMAMGVDSSSSSANPTGSSSSRTPSPSHDEDPSWYGDSYFAHDECDSAYERGDDDVERKSFSSPPAQATSLMYRIRPVPNPAFLRLKAVVNSSSFDKDTSSRRVREGALGGGKERVLGVAWEGRGGSALRFAVGVVCS